MNSIIEFIKWNTNYAKQFSLYFCYENWNAEETEVYSVFSCFSGNYVKLVPRWGTRGTRCILPFSFYEKREVFSTYNWIRTHEALLCCRFNSNFKRLFFDFIYRGMKSKGYLIWVIHDFKIQASIPLCVKH